MSAHIGQLRALVGHELLLLPSVSVLPVDEAGRVLLVRHAGHDDGWAVLGGAVEIGESPVETAIRAAYVAAVYEAEIIAGVPAAADGELSDVAWFSPSELRQLTLSRLSRALLTAIGRI